MKTFNNTIVLLVVKADAKDMGGHLSHEYHYLEPIGEAKLQNCPECQSYSIDATENEEDVSECPECHAKNMEKTSGIEVRWSFEFRMLPLFVQMIWNHHSLKLDID